MRGKDIEWNRGFPNVRITPAYAGKSSIVSPSSAVDWDHPRLCGEKFQKNRRSPCYKGSPPPMRGKVKCSPSKLYPKRITPAYAGKSRRITSSFSSMRDHPRLCGEKCTKYKLMICTIGSPPPMRGKGCPRLDTCDTGRITPAYAGKSHIFMMRLHSG